MLDKPNFGLSLTAAVALIASASLQAQSPSLFTNVSSVSSAVSDWEELQRNEDGTLVSSRFVRVNQDLHTFVAAPRAGTRTYAVELGGQTHEIEFRHFDQQLDFISVVGTVEGVSGADSTIVLTEGRSVVSGVFEWGTNEYMLMPTNELGIHALFTRDSGLDIGRAPCATTHDRTEAQQPVEETRTLLSGPSLDAVTTVDVATFYTPAARQQAGGAGNLENAIANRISISNTGNQQSGASPGVEINFRLVHMGETNYTANGNSDVSRFRNTNDGFMDEVHAIRNGVGADLMTLITTVGGYCGVAYSIMCTPSQNFRTNAFSVTVRSCLSNRSFAHEMGHTMGLAHDRANAGCGAYAYSYGARTSNNQFRSIMSYSPGTRVQRWSGPNTTWNSQTIGDPNNDNTRTLNNVKDIIAAFKPTQVGANPPTITNVSPTSTDNYTAGTFIVTVTGTELDTVSQINLGSGTVPILNQTASSLDFAVPNGYEIGTLNLTVENFAGASNVDTFTVNGSHPSVMVLPGIHSQGLAIDYSVYTDKNWIAVIFISDSNLPSSVPNLVTFDIGNNFATFFQFIALQADAGGLANVNVPIPVGTVPPFTAFYFQALTYDQVLTIPLEVSNSAGVIYF